MLFRSFDKGCERGTKEWERREEAYGVVLRASRQVVQMAMGGSSRSLTFSSSSGPSVREVNTVSLEDASKSNDLTHLGLALPALAAGEVHWRHPV